MIDDDKTMMPRNPHNAEFDYDVTVPGERARRADGRFAVGDLIMNRYKVLSELGRGGMGVVYKCFDEIAGVEVALKALPPELSHNTLEMEDIRRNFQIVHNLHHPNIASYNNLERDYATGNYYLIMECCEGEDLRRWGRRKRENGTLNLTEVFSMIQQVATALDYAHSIKIIHRDIKPSNIMIDRTDKVKVLDFGLAAQIHTSMTRVSMAPQGTSGTGPYMAPEQWRGRPQDARVDQYALAVMTYEMLAGYLPFESSDVTVLREAVLNKTPEPISNIPGYVMATISRAMSKDPAQRFASCGEFAAALSCPVCNNTVTVMPVSSGLSSIPSQSSNYNQTAQNIYAVPVPPVAPIPSQRSNYNQTVAVPVPPVAPVEPWRGSIKQKKNSKLKWWGVSVVLILLCGVGGYYGYSFFEKEDSSGGSGGASGSSGSTSTTQTFTLPDGVKLEMVKITAGTFTMGSRTGEKGHKNDENQHEVTLTKDYYLGKYEVTQAQYETVMGRNPSQFKSADRPVENVSWHDAREFCEELNRLTKDQLKIDGVQYKFDLPTEAQWEYACRAGTTTALNSGEDMQLAEENNAPNLDKVGWYAGNCGQDFELSNGHDISSLRNKQYSDTKGGPHPVGKKEPNKWGLYDMHGNVSEWCSDWYNSYANEKVTDPVGPSSGSYRVFRGGSWWRSAQECRSAKRDNAYPGNCGNLLGFRLALVPAE